MKPSEQSLHCVMDESDAPYEDGEYTPTLEDDLMAIRFAKKYGLEFRPGTRLAKLSQTLNGNT